MFQTEYINENWQQTLQRNRAANFDALWQLQQDNWFEAPNQRRGGWSGVCKTTLTMPDGSETGIFIKRQENHFYRSWRHGFQLRPTFEREYRNILAFHRQGVPTVELIYFGCRKVDGKWRAILVTRELQGYRPLADAAGLMSSALPLTERKALFENLAASLRKIHGAGFQHNCLYPKHIFVRKEAGTASANCFIDLEKARKTMRPQQAAIKDLGIMHRHTENCSKTDRLRFFLAYRQETKLSAASKAMLKTITRPKVRAPVSGASETGTLKQTAQKMQPGKNVSMNAAANQQGSAYQQGRLMLSSVRYPLFLAAMTLAIWFILRLGLWLEVGPEELTPGESLRTFALGAWFDFWTLAWLLSGFLLVSALLGNRFRAGRIAHAIRWAVAWGAVAALLFGIAAEYLFWQEFSTRFNFIALDYLIYTHEVIGNIRESYPVIWIFAAIGLLASLIVWISSRYLRFADSPHSWQQRALLGALALILPLSANLFANLDQTALSGNTYAQELGANGLFNLAAAMRRNDLDYNRFYATMPQAEADATLAALGVRRRPDMHKVNLPAGSDGMGPFIKRPKNLVMITVESLSASYLGAYGNQENLTPELDKLAKQGLKFEHLYATGTRTVRGLEALSLGTPPIPGQAIVRRPDNDHLATLGEYLEIQGYATEFVYGGYGYFDNMNAYFEGNDFKVTDRTDFDAKSIVMENVWGVADESLFDNAMLSLDRAAAGTQPFFVQVMTTSNHRPFTFPEGRIDLPPGSRKAAVKYTDYAIGRFIEQARSKPWFDDTLFVIVADHCASVAGKSRLPVAKYHIPMIFYAPALLKPATHTRMASQIDVPPTLLDLLGVAGAEHFFGQNMFAANATAPRAFVSNYQSLGYYKNDRLVVLLPKQRVEAYRINPQTYEAEPAEADRQMVKEAIAYYQTAANAFKHGGLKELPVMAASNALDVAVTAN